MNPWVVEYCVVVGWLFLLGTVVGSMLSVWIHRLPREERFWKALRSLGYPPSNCPRCGGRIAARDNIPIVGWLLLRGRCRFCRGWISMRYPLIELLMGLLFVVVYWYEIPGWWASGGPGSLSHPFGPSGIVGSAWLSPMFIAHYRYALHMVLLVALVAATFIDFDCRIIPDTVTLPAMTIGILANTILGHVYIVPLWYATTAMTDPANPARMLLVEIAPRVPQGMLLGWPLGAFAAYVPAWIGAHPHLHGLCVSLAGIAVGGGAVWGVRLVGQWVLRREAMGFGDVVLMATIGSILGWQAALAVFFIAPVCAMVVAIATWIFRRDREIPYGPYLSLAALLLLLFFRAIWPRVETHVLAFGPLLLPVALMMFVALGGLLFVVHTILRAVGMASGEAGPEEQLDGEWTSADQLAYLAGECTDERQGQWCRPTWRGGLTGRGYGQYDDWRGLGGRGNCWHQRRAGR